MLKNSNYVFGPRDVQIPLHISFGEFILGKLMQFKDNIAFVNGETHETLQYGQIAQQAMSFAVSLAQLGVRKGDTVAICSENRQEFFPAVIGVICTGAVVTTFSMIYTKDEINHVASISKPKYIIASPGAYKNHELTFKSLKSIKKVILFGDHRPSTELLYKDLTAGDVKYEDFLAADVQGQTDTMLILYSSGTTGLPKGVMMTHMNLISACSMVQAGMKMPSSTNQMITPWYHTMGLLGCLVRMTTGNRIVYLPKFEEKLYLETIQRYKPEILTVVPPVAILLAKSQILDKYDVSSVLLIYSGAAPLDLETIEAVKKRFPNLTGVLQGYGMTETALAVCRDSEASPCGIKQGSCGPPVAGMIMKVVDLETHKPQGPNKHGEICVKGPGVMKGYVDKDRGEDFDNEGFLRTGDIGYFDEDGYFYIVDRLKELIKYKGFQVPPAEIEAVLVQHKGVRDAGVIGIPHKSAGEVPLAFVVRQPGEEVSEKEIQEFIAAKLSNPKRLRGGVRFVSAIPKNPSGKILRRKLKEFVKSGRSKL